MNLFDKLRHSNQQQRVADLRPRLFRMAMLWCGNANLSDDLVQETLEKGLKKLDQLKDPAALDGWLFSILANCFRDFYRAQSRVAEVYGDAPDPGQPSAEEEAATGETVLRVRRAIGGLTQGQRQVLTLVDLEGMSYAEVAQVLELPMGTVMSRLNRGRRQLKALLLKDQAGLPRPSYLERVK